MSSSPQAEPKRVRRPWSLRRRLIVQLAALLALVCLVVGVVTEFALTEFLVGQQDKRLAAASDRASHVGERPPPWTYGETPPPPDALRVLGQGEGTLAVVTSGSKVSAAVLDSSAAGASRRKPPFKDVSPDQARRLLSLPADGKQRSIDLGGSLGDYRVVSTLS